MANVRVDVRMSPNFEQVIMAEPSVASEVTKTANEIAGRANSMATELSGVWHEVGEPHTPGREGGTWRGSNKVTETVGGTRPNYKAKPARRTGANGTPIAIVVTANHAAQKDNMKNNTLLKAKG